MLYILYFLIILLLFWNYFGYLIFLKLLFKIKNRKNNPLIKNIGGNLPTIEFIIPCFNEEYLIKDKIKNLRSLNYPSSKIQFTFVDGGSTDKTIEIINEIAVYTKINLIKTRLRNKIKQLNKIISKSNAEIIIISDVDTKLKTKIVKKMVYEFMKDFKIMVVGANTKPLNTISTDIIYWEKQNQIRVLESQTISSSIVIAACYAFRKSLMLRFPEDVIADDVYIAYLAQSKGWKVSYTSETLAYELRCPKIVIDFIRHKFRKSHAFIIEQFRFLPTIFEGSWQWQLIYITKFLQIIGAPFLLLFLLILTIYFLLITPIFVVNIFLLLLTSIALISFLTKDSKYTNNDFTHQAFLSFVLINVILFCSIIVYPFFKQTASYKKI